GLNESAVGTLAPIPGRELDPLDPVVDDDEFGGTSRPSGPGVAHGSVRDRVNGRAHRCCKINPCMQAATSRDRVGPHSIVGTDPKHSRWERGRDAYGAVARVSELGLAGG